ncbi:RcnB family protein [Terricaulis silvestris]|uniref:Putative integral membrane protein n=1 Tax=Terricaulis silvestris TaxID=2686094 RepID=A0A6I6MHI8_9CAUL|nr:RcnB family protein [Terricaulis silvestris]QGZ94340.1 putative integral membrane protein [Terricaulis silvestris]
MKRITLAAAAALMMAGPLVGTASAQDYRGQRGDVTDRDDRGDRGRTDNDWNRGDRGDRNDDRADRGRDDNDWNRGDRRGDRSDRRDRRDDRRGDNRRHRWDNQRHNGYTYNGRWYYGPPPGAYEGRNGYESGYRNWRRGERLPSYYQSRYRQVDYRREHLRAPPRGYRYVEDDRGDMLLVGIATGVILSIILSQ